MGHLDKVERAILCGLDCNSRQALVSLGKSVRLTKESVHYRLKQLEARHIILGYPTIISLAKMGKMHVELFLKVHNVTLGLKHEMIHFFVQQPEIVSVASCKGNWDIILGIVVHDITELNRVKDRICDTYALYFAELSLSYTTETYFLGRKYLVGKDIHITQQVDKPAKESITPHDDHILASISQNARKSLLQIAHETGISAKVVAYHLKKLERTNIIQKYTVALNMNALGMTTYKLLLRIKHSSYKKTLLAFFHRQPNTVQVREVLANWSLEPTIEVESAEQFYAIVHAIEDQFGEAIMTHSSFMIDKDYKAEYYQ
ncbi:Lrp/AsnC family transcriptional regulator [Candidatus Woesearchaeota archaeon]|nr:Lrp/AsnC family transcriptional regulator [Candidatus Woesearchaeota archaeon]